MVDKNKRGKNSRKPRVNDNSHNIDEYGTGGFHVENAYIYSN